MKKSFVLPLLLVLVCATAAANKPYITRVLDYRPAPGQFINTMPPCAVGEPYDSVLARAGQRLCGYDSIRTATLPNGRVVTDTVMVTHHSLVSLGAFGGNVVMAFDHPVVNVAGERDFQVFGNAFLADSGNVSAAGSSEPGIVMVSRDINGNGLPDDAWYELAGSEYANSRTQHAYTITYYKPDENKVRTPDGRFLPDTTYIRWTSNDPDSLATGHIMRNSFHTQPYWPRWIGDDQLIFSGTKLRCNYYDEGGAEGGYFVQHFFDWGYVDNRHDYAYDEPLTDDIASHWNLGFDIDWAVDSQGRHIDLPYVDFIKVYTALNQQCGWIGETSTEVGGAIDLHPDAPMPKPIYGDINADGLLDISDLALLVNSTLAGQYQPEADLNADGMLDIVDVNIIINTILRQ